jgi:acetyl-CoA acetyltransferase
MPVGTAIVGIGATEFSKDSGRSELRLAVEAVSAALTDAGLTAADVDGLVTFTMDSNAEIAVARELGLRELRFFSQVGYGGGAACATVQHAAMAVATGIAEVVVCYRALNERSGRRFGQVAAGLAGVPTTAGIDNGWHYPMGLVTPAATVAMVARRYMHEYGAVSEDFGRVTVAARRHAATNPNAWFYQRPVTLAEHQASRWIAEPLRLLDCCQESDGAVAIVVTSLDRARDLPRRPAVIAAAAQGSGPGQYIMTSYYRDDLAALPEMGVVAGQLWRQAGLAAADIRTAMLYDHFTPYVLIQLEELGFCPRGEARNFIAGGAIELGGGLPLNTHGGQLGEAYIHGMNGIAEAVRQVRGTSVNQVPGDGPVLVTAGTGVPTSGLILSLPEPGQPPAACTSAVTADATVARSPRVANAMAVTFGGLPAAAPATTNRTELNLLASASAAARSGAPDATITLQPRTSSDPANGAAATSVSGPVTARYDTRAVVEREASCIPAHTCAASGSARPRDPVSRQASTFS